MSWNTCSKPKRKHELTRIRLTQKARLSIYHADLCNYFKSYDMNYMPIQKWFRISKWNILAVDNIPINAAIYLNENDIAKQNPNLLE